MIVFMKWKALPTVKETMDSAHLPTNGKEIETPTKGHDELEAQRGKRWVFQLEHYEVQYAYR